MLGRLVLWFFADMTSVQSVRLGKRARGEALGAGAVRCFIKDEVEFRLLARSM